MKLHPIEAGNFKLDGGAMFGVVPKTIWNKTNPADENNLIDIAARCLLIEDNNRLILIEIPKHHHLLSRQKPERDKSDILNAFSIYFYLKYYFISVKRKYK